MTPGPTQTSVHPRPVIRSLPQRERMSVGSIKRSPEKQKQKRWIDSISVNDMIGNTCLSLIITKRSLFFSLWTFILTTLPSDEFQTSPWKKVRPVIHVIPFVQMFKHKKYPWVQLAGHPGNFLRGLQQVSGNMWYTVIGHWPSMFDKTEKSCDLVK